MAVPSPCRMAMLWTIVVSGAMSNVIMQQKTSSAECSDALIGTWAVNRPGQNYTEYYRVSAERWRHSLLLESHWERPLPFGVKRESTKFKTAYTTSVLDVYRHVIALDDDCKLTMKDGATWKKVEDVTKVHVIYMNHLDVGYNVNHFYPGTKILIPGYIFNVLNWYFQVYFPRAAKLGDELRALRANETFIYTTHPWLVNLYLNCPELELSGIKLQCPTEAQKVVFRRAVWMGDITWHAGPLNQEAESSNPELFSYSLTLSEKLDQTFGIKREARTLSQRDIPGMTRAAIPYMVRHNIRAVSFGVNGVSAPPDVPSPNVWTYGNDSVITYWHKGGYPDAPGPSPQNPGGLSRQDCQFVQGLNEVLCFIFRSDNLGPPLNVQEIKTDFEILRYEFPGADVRAAKFEDFTKLLIPLKHKFPVVDAEIGDTWIQGPSSDPVKMIRYRTINRMRSQCVKSKQCSTDDPRFDDFSRLLLKLPEHTYGLGSNFDTTHYSNEQFQPLQYTKESFRNNTLNYLGHRAFNDFAVSALKNHTLAKQIRLELDALKPYLPSLDGYEILPQGKMVECGNGMKIKIGPDGSLVELIDRNGNSWASEKSRLAKILYRTYSEKDYADVAHQYNYRPFGAFWKFNYANAKPESKFWDVEAEAVFVPRKGDPCSQGIYARIVHTDMQTWFKYGAPTVYYLKYTTDKVGLDIEYQFFNKPSTRMVEALFLSFESPERRNFTWLLNKVGYWVDPSRVVNNGSQYVHGVDMGAGYLEGERHSGMVIESLDTATVSVLTKDRPADVLPVPLTPMKSTPTGVAFNLYNNVWETNFIFWYPFEPQDKHFKARFRISFP